MCSRITTDHILCICHVLRFAVAVSDAGAVEVLGILVDCFRA